MSALLELAARVEGLAGPDRRIDAEICLALGLSGGNPIVSPGCDGWLVGSESNPNPVEAARYTASLDAAMALIPEGRGRGAFAMSRDSFGRTHCDVWTDVEFNRREHGSAKSAALALCAAALRAKAVGEGV